MGVIGLANRNLLTELPCFIEEGTLTACAPVHTKTGALVQGAVLTKHNCCRAKQVCKLATTSLPDAIIKWGS